MKVVPWILLLSLASTVGCKQRENVSQPLSDSAPVWDTIGPGLKFREFNLPGPVKAFVVSADLTHPSVMLIATRNDKRMTPVSQFAADHQCRVALNGDLFSGKGVPLGLAIGGQSAWKETKDNERSAFMAAGLDGRVAFSKGTEVKTPESWMYSLVSGFPMMVQDGKHGDLTCKCREDFYAGRHPRSAIGATADMKTAFFVAVDGRSASSKGMTIKELADFMLSIGAHNAINLDGGGSTALFIQDKGIVNQPSDGKERRVSNHIGVCNGTAMDLAAIQKARPSFQAAPPIVVPESAGDTHRVSMKNSLDDPGHP